MVIGAVKSRVESDQSRICTSFLFWTNSLPTVVVWPKPSVNLSLLYGPLLLVYVDNCRARFANPMHYVQTRARRPSIRPHEKTLDFHQCLGCNGGLNIVYLVEQRRTMIQQIATAIFDNPQHIVMRQPATCLRMCSNALMLYVLSREYVASRSARCESFEARGPYKYPL